MFEDWWKVYPRKVGKLDAAKAYAAAIKKGTSHDELLAGCRAFAILVLSRGTDRAYIPHPGTWLRAGRWLDDELSNCGRSAELGEPLCPRDRTGARNDYAETIARRITDNVFQAYFSGCTFTETAVIAPTEARKAMLINRFRHKLPDMIVEVRHD